MQCTNCGHELIPGSAFCGNCGAQLLSPQQPQQPTQQAPTTQPVSQIPPAPTPQPVPEQPNPAPQQPAMPVSPTPATLPQAPITANPSPGAYAVPKQSSSGLSIASMVLGILSIFCCLVWFMAIPFGVTAVILGFLGKGKGGKGMAIAGIITGLIGTVLSIIITAAAVSYVENNPEQFPEAFYWPF